MAKHLTHQQHVQHKATSKWNQIQKLLAIGYTMQWQSPRNAEEVVMPRWQVCRNRIDAFMLEKGTVKKEVKDMTGAELSKAITQLQLIAKDFINKV